MNMRSLSHDNPELKSLKKAISNYVSAYEAMGVPYWVFVEDSNLVGIVSIGKEPIQLLAPPGTTMSEIRVLDLEGLKETLKEFASRALSLSKENAAKYSITRFPVRYKKLNSQFISLGFQELAENYQMVCPLDRPFEPSSVLRFERVQRNKMKQFLERFREFMSGSFDPLLNLKLRNSLEFPENFLDFWFNLHRFYFVYKEEQIVGILELSGYSISNIGVSPQHRRKGYGRQIMHFGLKTLKEEGRERAYLRVHVDNAPAIHLYKILGFSVMEHDHTLIYTSRSRL